MPEFTRHSRIADVAATPRGRELLRRHGYELGEGFTDVLSQCVSLEDALLEGRLRDLPGLLRELSAEASRAQESPAAAS